MQYLIDIIKELVHSQLGYFDRGDVPFDFAVGDFTRDNAWHDLDLSAIVPADAQAVNLFVSIRASVINQTFLVRRKGYVQWGSFIGLHTQVANQHIDAPGFLVAIDNDRVIQYKVKSVQVNVIDFAVRGWWLR